MLLIRPKQLLFHLLFNWLLQFLCLLSMSLQQEGVTYGPGVTPGIELTFVKKFAPRDTNISAMWPADEKSRPTLVSNIVRRNGTEEIVKNWYLKIIEKYRSPLFPSWSLNVRTFHLTFIFTQKRHYSKKIVQNSCV